MGPLGPKMFRNEELGDPNMILAMAMTMPVLAAGWSLLYLLCGGGFGGAVLIFIVLKMFGK